MKKLFFGLCLSLLIQGNVWAQNCGLSRFTCTPTPTFFTPTITATPTKTSTPTFTPTGSWTPVIPANASMPQGAISQGNLLHITNSGYSIDSQGFIEGLSTNVTESPSNGFGSLYGSTKYFGYNGTTYSSIVMSDLLLFDFGVTVFNSTPPYEWYFDPADGALDGEDNPLDNIGQITAQSILLQNGVTVYATPGVTSSPVPGVTGLSQDGSTYTMGIRTSFAATPTPNPSGAVTTTLGYLNFINGLWTGAGAAATPTPNILSGFVTLANDLTPVAVSNANFSATTKMVITAKNAVTGVVNSFGVTCTSGACTVVGTATGAVTAMWIAQP